MDSVFPEDSHDVAHLVGLGLIMGVIFLRPAYGFAEHRVDEAALHIHHHRLGILVAHHDALQHALGHLFVLFSRPSGAVRSSRS